MLLTIKMHLVSVFIELRFLAVPPCNQVTVLRLQQVISSNGRTALIFHILLIAQARSGWRQQQLLTCFLFRFFNLVL
jgi:hypothetical protein